LLPLSYGPVTPLPREVCSRFLLFRFFVDELDLVFGHPLRFPDNTVLVYRTDLDLVGQAVYVLTVDDLAGRFDPVLVSDVFHSHSPVLFLVIDFDEAGSLYTALFGGTGRD